MNDLQNWMVQVRRDLHIYAEPGWSEFRTSSIVAEELSRLGYRIMMGKEIIEETAVMGRDEKIIPEQIQRAREQNRNGWTGWMDSPVLWAFLIQVSPAQ